MGLDKKLSVEIIGSLVPSGKIFLFLEIKSLTSLTEFWIALPDLIFSSTLLSPISLNELID